MADPYAVLGVGKTASQDEIRAAYRKLAKESHPDLHPGNAAAEKRFKDISAAYDILGDEAKRKRFDAGEIDEHGAERPERKYYRQYAEAGPGFRYGRGTGEDFVDMDDIFADLFRGRGEGFRMPGASVRYRLPVDFLEAVNGARKTVSMPDGKTLDIKIPAGVRDGQVLRLKGQGLPGAGGAPPGDALVEVEVLPHPRFTRDGRDIRSVLPITIAEALAGAAVRAETIAGPVDVKIPKGANSGTTLRLKGKGVKHEGRGAPGDHLLELRIVLPDKRDPELERLVAEWEAKHPYNPRLKGERA
ncbi:MAG TPA: J domain-containing protein [Hyphomicrobiaceae bacterium]|nr:J domain-containing protein [Hyphomicrobiaceae bacterium]